MAASARCSPRWSRRSTTTARSTSTAPPTLARWLVDHGNDGLVVAGTTGEAPMLTDDEQVDLWRAVREAVDVPVVAGTGTNDTAPRRRADRRAADAGVDGVLVVTPYYNRPSQAGLEAHFRAVADATDLPVMLYDIPVRTGRKIDHDVLLAPGPRGAQHRRRQGRRRRSRPSRPG